MLFLSPFLPLDVLSTPDGAKNDDSSSYCDSPVNAKKYANRVYLSSNHFYLSTINCEFKYIMYHGYIKKKRSGGNVFR